MVIQNKAQAGSEDSGLSGTLSREAPQKRRGDRAQGTKESRAVHMNEGKTAIADTRSHSALSLHRGLRVRVLRGHFIIWQPAPYSPAPFPFRQQRRMPGERVGCASVQGATLRPLVGWQPPSAKFLFAYCIALLSQAAAVVGIAGREAERGRGRGRDREAARKKQEEEKKVSNSDVRWKQIFYCVQPCGLIQGNI